MQADYERKGRKRELWAAQWRLALYVVWTLIGISILVYFSGSALDVLSIPVGIVIWTTILVFTLRGLVERLCEREVPRALAITVAFLLLFAALWLLVLLIRPMFSFGLSANDLVDTFSSSVGVIQGHLQGLYDEYPGIFSDPRVVSWIDSSLASLVSYGERGITGLAHNMVGLAGSAVNALMCIMFSLVAAFWLLLEMPRMRAEMGRLFGEGAAADIDFLGATFSRVIGGFIKGMFVQCLVIGVSCFIAYSLIGFKNPHLYAVIVAMCNILPVLGQWVGVFVIVVASVFSDPMTAILMIAATLVIERIVYMFIYPKIMADSVNVHPVMIIISMMVGYALGSALSGVMGSLVGILVSIPLAAVAKAVFVYYFEKKTGRHLVAEDGVFFKGVPNEGEEPDPHLNAVSPHPAIVNRAPSLIEKAIKKCGKMGDPSQSCEDGPPQAAAPGASKSPADHGHGEGAGSQEAHGHSAQAPRR